MVCTVYTLLCRLYKSIFSTMAIFTARTLDCSYQTITMVTALKNWMDKSDLQHELACAVAHEDHLSLLVQVGYINIKSYLSNSIQILFVNI